MKKLLLTLSIALISLTGFAQEKKDVSYSLYVPSKTYHWDRSEVDYGAYTKGEGGVGLIATRKVKQNKRYYTTLSAGVVKNSYWDTSVVLMVGAGVEVSYFNVGASLGIATGYHQAYINSSQLRESTPGFMSNNGILPYAAIDISLTKGLKITDKIDVTPMVVISPVFANAGLRVNL